ncbi:MAG TPA: DinB family protein [Holophagaceae bacterium]|nr:DinB family protein [Holophagaceae bacterium]
MRAQLQDLVAHLRWADAVAFHALGKCPAAQADPDVLERLFHAAWVASAFAAILAGAPGGRPPEDRPAFGELRDLTRAAGEALQTWVDHASEGDLETSVHIPWFPEPPLHLPAREALLQAVLHTQHHRGQTMTRLKQLGGESKNVDFIIWLWKRKPAPRWD